jgi:hypothetical protein
MMKDYEIKTSTISLMLYRTEGVSITLMDGEIHCIEFYIVLVIKH